MSMTHPPNPGLAQAPAAPWYDRLHPSARWAGLLLAFYLGGPMIFYAHDTQVDTAGPAWQAEKRWAIVNGKAIASLLWYVPIVVFHAPLAAFWATIFATVASWLHLPFLARLGDTTLLPPLPASTLLRWLLACPLAGLLTLGLEAVQPRTSWQTRRIITAEEQQEMDAIAADQEKKQLAKAQRELKTTQQAATSPPSGAQTPQKAPPRPRKPRAPTTPEEKAGQLRPKADSLWGQIDWNTIPADHPFKRAVREEAERLETERLEQSRKQWLTQQRQTAHGLTISPQIVDAAPVPPVSPALPAPPPTQADTADEQYNWDEGEGSIQA